MEDETLESRNQARLAILELTNMISVPMCLHAIVRLNVPDAIWQGGSNAPLSASQILTRVLPSGDPHNLQRILRLLTTYGVFAEHLLTDPSSDQVLRKYSLTDIGKTLVTDADGLSYGAYVLQHYQEELMTAWPLVHEAVVDSTTEPFVKANGEPAYSYYVQRLVDVGGSAGDCLRMILQKHTNIKEGINFDLPEVVAKAPNIPGVTHVGGDMFKSVPDGDAIFMKSEHQHSSSPFSIMLISHWVLTTWTDEECKLIMKNCYNALPVGGKMIACEPVLPKESDNSLRTRALLEGDIFVMTIYRAKGKHRTEEEFRQLGLSAGFPHLRAFYIDHFYTVLEFQK
ncbi:Caffeic acid 3-O-methyltransferase [Vitis vinifera]|uniref:Caffeic acid 3-O-methyltransferase n=1 Tax=Vitis vinifera TaxID=29760 RepID=A0A438JS60_VITVI|nr:Caffeic acid 3-O-methyltransferase [Vitis vinifera]